MQIRGKRNLQLFYWVTQQEISYYSSKSDEADNTIDLAYAITVHKSQGSDFKIVWLFFQRVDVYFHVN